MDNYLENKSDYCISREKMKSKCNNCSELSFVNGSFKSTLVNLPTSQKEARKKIIIDTITINTSCCCETKIKVDFNVNILSNESVQVNSINFQVYKICDNLSYKIPVGGNVFYKNSGTDLLQITVQDDNICNSKRCTYVLEATI